MSDLYTDLVKSFSWERTPEKILTGNFGDMKWFEDGKLNITINAIDRHAKNTPNKIAFIWEPNNPTDKNQSYTYAQLLLAVNKYSNVLKDQGINKGDRVCFYMSMVPELMIGVLACARVGAIHSVVFGGFSANALQGRINDCKAKLLVTNDQAYRGDKIIELKEISNTALKECPTIENVLCLKHSGNKVEMKQGRDKWLNELLEQASSEFTPEVMDAEDPLFILYTSGSTGRPKGLVHTTAGYMAWSQHTYKNVFQTNKNSIFWCSADIGWITGHTYITYGPLLAGDTQVIFEGVPTFPTPARFWDVIDKYKVTHFYTAPTAIRALQACDQSFVENANLTSLQVLGSVGEPINLEAWDWYNEKVGKKKCPIVDTWWQTETGGIMISPLAGKTPCIPCHATLPLLGVEPILVDTEGNIIEGNPASGNLCIKTPWPGIARTIYGDHKRYLDTYFSTYPGYYFTGDGAKRDTNGNYRITGRVDDVVNVSGHRIGTAEVEDVINKTSIIIESAVVGIPHPIKGESLIAFAIAHSNEPDVLKQVNAALTKQIGAIAKLENIFIVSDLPKTRSGKIMRRVLRKIGSGQEDQIGDTSTLVNPQIVEELKKISL